MLGLYGQTPCYSVRQHPMWMQSSGQLQICTSLESQAFGLEDTSATMSEFQAFGRFLLGRVP